MSLKFDAVWSTKNKRWETHGGRYYFDVEAANKACDFYPTFLTHHAGEWADRPFELLDYQRALVVRPFFGWKLASDGVRRFRFLFLFVPKGNGKSPLGSGGGLYLTLCDDEAGAEVYAVAGSKAQAKVVHETAKIMVENSADLLELCEIVKDSIFCPQSRSFYKVLTAEAGTAHGVRPHGTVIDELHNQQNRDLYEALRKSMLKRRQPAMWLLSHSGTDDESICYEEYEYARRVLSGTVNDEAYLPVMFEATDKDDWTKEETWKKCNPGYGVTINPTIFAAECRAAQDEPRKRNDFLRFNLNRWVGQATSWIPVEWWNGCEGELIDEQLAGLQCTAGLDMAQKIDLVSFSVTLREFLPEREAIRLEVKTEDEEGREQKLELSLNYRVFVKPFFWLPEATVRDCELEGFTSYQQWKEQGLLFVTEGASIDYDRVYKDITQKILPRFPLLKQGEIGYDPAFATDIASRLRDKAGLQVVEILQNYKYMNEPCHVFEALVKSKRLVHDGNRLMRWNVENVAVKRDDAGRVRPVKPAKRTKKVDGVVATLMGLHRLMATPTLVKQSFKVDWVG